MSAAAVGANRLHELGEAYFRRRYAILFCSLLLTLAGAPISIALGGDAEGIKFFLAANLVAAVLPVGLRAGRYVLLGLLAVEVAMRATTVWRGIPELSAGGLVVWTVVGLFAAASAGRFALRARSVDSEHLYAALDVYLLAGVFFGVFYWFLERTVPGSLLVGGVPLAGDLSAQGAIYFSFVTLATLGYGDIVPVGDAARGVAVIEAVTGQLYLAVMIARLVSLYVVRAKAGDKGR